MMEASLFFVMGVPKSGTTWLQRALDAHPEVTCLGEGKFHYFRDRLADAGVAYNRFLADRGSRVFGEISFPKLSIDEVDAVFAAFIETRIRRAAGLNPASRIGAKDPDFGLYIEEFAPLFATIPYVHIVRDPRDVAVSMHHHMTRAHPEVKYPSVDASLLDTARGWRHYLEGVRAETARRRLNCLEITYEGLSRDPTAVLGRVFDHLDVASDTAVVAYCVERSRFRALSQGREPGQEDRSSFYRKGVAGGWRDELTSAQAAAIVQAAGPLAQELGYGSDA